MFGGHKGVTLLLSYHVELTSEEQVLVTKYKEENYILTFTTDRKGNKITKDTVSSLMRSSTEALDDVTILLNNEDIVKNTCKNFKTLLDIMATFGGEEVIKF